MSGTKIFAGARLRRMRNRLGLSQTALAQALAISASYLNLIERDQRPLTAQIILKLSALHGADITELTGMERDSDMLAALKEMVADPLLAGEIPVASELTEAAQVAPNLIGAALKLYRAYHEVLKRLGDLSQEIAVSGTASANAAESPFETVRRWLLDHPPLYPALEALAEEIWFELSPKDDPMAGLKARLRNHSGIDVRILPVNIMPVDYARYDRHSQRLFLAERLDVGERLLETARLVASLEGRAAIDAIIAGAPFAANPESTRLARQSLLRLLAIAILCPAAKFTAAAQDLHCDIAALSARFGVDRGIVMQRLSALSTRPVSDVPIGFLAVDGTGAIVDRCGRLGFFLPKSGSLCGQLPVFDAIGDVTVARLLTPDSKILVMIAIPNGKSRITSALCLSADDAAKTVYGPLAAAWPVRPIGPSCRLCEVKNCILRREPPASRPAAMNEFVRGASDFEPVS